MTTLYLLQYDVVEDYIARRAAHRDAHLSLANAAAERGELLLGGAVDAGAGGALLVFTGRAAAEAFASADPYVSNGVVVAWRIREWSVAAGSAANASR